MSDDPIVDEVRQARKCILEKYDNDFVKMSKHAMERQWVSGHRVVSPTPRKQISGVVPNIYPMSVNPETKK